jgi:hypothetical protein
VEVLGIPTVLSVKKEAITMKRDIKNTWGFLWALVLVLGFILGPGAAWADPPPWAPAYGHRAKHHHGVTYKYIYYPSSQVYYSPVQHRYYYMDNGAWIYGVTVPPSIRLGKSVSVDLGGPVPYIYHPTVIQQYPVVVVPAD